MVDRLAFATVLWFFLFQSLSSAEFPYEDLAKDLTLVNSINQKLNERLPVNYNNLLQGGYWNMPSARMGQEGEVGLGYTYMHPYYTWNLRCQLTDRFEVSGNYRVFIGIKDNVLSQYGFGDFSDKGANFKFSLLQPEDSDYALPGFAFGFEDVMGTRAFKAKYIVLTQVFLDRNLEISVGYGRQRIRGWFGGLSWMPLRKSPYSGWRSLTLVAEYDAIPYWKKKVEPHPKGHQQRIPINVGLKYRLWDTFDFSASYNKGLKWAFSVSTFYNFGDSKGVFAKVDTPRPYRAPINIEPLGALRPVSVLVPDLAYAFERQGFTLLETWLSTDDCEKVLRLRIINNFYRLECNVREQLNHLMAYLIPLDIDKVIVGIDCEGAVIQEYCYRMEIVRRFAAQEMGSYELKILSPLREATKADPYYDWLLFDRRRPSFCYDLLPKTYCYFGSATGKFKYALGLQVLTNGYLNENIFYSVAFGYIAARNIGSLKDVDRLNPSQLINVRTDIIRYYQQEGVTLDEAYLQKLWNLGRGHFFRTSLGYFEIEYGGLAAEWLYYPVNSRWAFGLEAAILGKRKVDTWFGFTPKIRKLHGFEPTYKRFVGSQFFVNFYYDWKEAKVDLRLKIGKFLANDYGIRYELSRYFSSGLRVTLWYTYTNGHDKINGQTYYDKGIYFSMPLDFFYTRCDQGTWSYGMSAWLRDVGATAFTGQELYYMLNSQRQ